jgi:hypothetical protein
VGRFRAPEEFRVGFGKKSPFGIAWQEVERDGWAQIKTCNLELP